MAHSMKCPQFILEIINRYTYPEIDHFDWSLFLKSLYRMFRGARPIFAMRMFFQKVFRKNHLCDLYIWETSCYMARECLKRLRAFKELERQGYPSDFCASHDDYSCSPEDYQKYIEEGVIIGGGPEKWEKTIDHIIMALEYVAYAGDEMFTKRAHDWWVKYFGFSPYDENQVNHTNYELLRYAESVVGSGLINMAVYWRNLWD
jgi:hypothetical protein